MKSDCYKNAFKFKLEMFDLWFRSSLKEFSEIKIFDHSDLRKYKKSWDFDYYLKDSDCREFNLLFVFERYSYKTLSEIDLYKFKMRGEIRGFSIDVIYTFENVEKFLELLRMIKKVKKIDFTNLHHDMEKMSKPN